MSEELDWIAVLADHTGSSLAELPANFTVERFYDRTPQIEVELSHEDEQAGLVLDALKNGLPRCYAYRRESGAWVLRASGEWRPMDETAEGDTSKMSLTFQGATGRFADRIAGRSGDGSGSTNTGEVVEYLGQETGAIGQALIVAAETEDDLGLQVGTVETTATREEQVYEWKNLADAFNDLSTGDQSIDWLESPLRDGTDFGQIDIYQDIGSRQEGVIFAHGASTLDNCRGARRSWLLPINHVVVLGADSVYQDAEDTSSIATYGRRSQTVALSDEIDAGVLLDKAQRALRPHPVRVVSMQPDPALAPSPWTDYDAGDEVEYHVNRGYFTGSGTVKLSGFSVTVEDGREVAHEVEWEDEEVL